MISDGHNLMLNSREEYRLWLILKNLSDDEQKYFQAEHEPDMILRRWINEFQAAMDEARQNPFVEKGW